MIGSFCVVRGVRQAASKFAVACARDNSDAQPSNVMYVSVPNEKKRSSSQMSTGYLAVRRERFRFE